MGPAGQGLSEAGRAGRAKGSLHGVPVAMHAQNVGCNRRHGDPKDRCHVLAHATTTRVLDFQPNADDCGIGASERRGPRLCNPRCVARRLSRSHTHLTELQVSARKVGKLTRLSLVPGEISAALTLGLLAPKLDSHSSATSASSLLMGPVPPTS